MEAAHKATAAKRSASLSRRSLIAFAGAGVVSALPGSALVAVPSKHQPTLSDEQQLKVCLDQLHVILGRISAIDDAPHYFCAPFGNFHFMTFRLPVRPIVPSTQGGKS